MSKQLSHLVVSPDTFQSTCYIIQSEDEQRIKRIFKKTSKVCFRQVEQCNTSLDLVRLGTPKTDKRTARRTLVHDVVFGGGRWFHCHVAGSQQQQHH